MVQPLQTLAPDPSESGPAIAVRRAPPERAPAIWPLWQRVAFRFAAVYFALLLAPWTWVRFFPYNAWKLSQWWGTGIDWVVLHLNASVLHVAPVLIPVNGSGDTSWTWAQFIVVITTSVVATIAWSVLDRRRLAYDRSVYWVRLVMRYGLMQALFQYGMIKVFPLQMPATILTEYATPFGDLLPQRLAWVMFGYSVPYQVFTGVVECIAGALLFWRGTVTLGLLLALGVMANVVIVDLTYDIPVKLYALELLALTIGLVAMEAPRLMRALLLNLPVDRNTLYDLPRFGLGLRLVRLVAKAGVVYAFALFPMFQGLDDWLRWNRPGPPTPFRQGVYDVRLFVRNGDTIPTPPYPSAGDGRRWGDLIIDNPYGGSVASTDTLFWQRYGRGYFLYAADTSAKTLKIWRTSMKKDRVDLFSARYAMSGDSAVRIWADVRGDSVYVELARTRRTFPLARRQFHWLSEFNR